MRSTPNIHLGHGHGGGLFHVAFLGITKGQAIRAWFAQPRGYGPRGSLAPTETGKVIVSSQIAAHDVDQFKLPGSKIILLVCGEIGGEREL